MIKKRFSLLIGAFIMIANMVNSKSYGNEILKLLNNYNIQYELYHHESVYTCEEADNIVPHQEGLFKSKNLLLKSKKKFFLVILPETKKVNFKELASKLHEKKLKFASSSDMESFGIQEGSVGPFSCLNNSIELILDEELKSHQTIELHPNTNDKTLVMNIDDLMKVIDSMEIQFQTFNI